MNSPQAAPTRTPEIPTLHTPRLVVRPLRETDLPAVQRNFQDYETVRYLNAVVPWPYPEDSAVTWYRDVAQKGQGSEQWTWAICQKEAPKDLIERFDWSD
jgi:RimJ/RimL family protein N-acetyltransferase